METILQDKHYIPFKEEIKFDGYKAIGYFPYSTKRIKGNKVPRILFEHLDSNSSCVKDNKVVVLFKDTTNFGTNDFAIFFHDLEAILGDWENVVDY